jgi:hypothetical protein
MEILSQNEMKNEQLIIQEKLNLESHQTPQISSNHLPIGNW